ncbi:ATP:cob(I)alamin adenosyltransferase [Candidatus Pacearchaeota archaeon]|nr:ATP:cob(I)alamin adenosyltransferase [Candidatus Pacearchaeota archaeon]
MSKVYTSAGDEGLTKDFSGKPYLKDDLMIVVNGKVDSLQSALDMALFLDTHHSEFLRTVQKKLWQASGEIANCPGDCLNAPVTADDLKELEEYIDSLGEPPNKFVRFTNETSIWFNECRVRCRELETFLVKMFREGKLRSEIYRYINRLSSLFFMLGYKAG